MVIRESLPGIDLAPLQSVLVDLAPQGRSGLPAGAACGAVRVWIHPRGGRG